MDSDTDTATMEANGGGDDAAVMGVKHERDLDHQQSINGSLKSSDGMNERSFTRLSINSSRNGVHAVQHCNIPNDFQSSCLQLLRCNMCSQMLYPPIYSCRKGSHTFCSACKRGKCRICKSKFSKRRNQYLESMLALVKLECSNKLCSEMISGEQIDNHKADCQYRPIPCFETDNKKCRGQPINFENYESHLIEIHGTTVQEMEEDWTFVEIKFKNILAEANRLPLQILSKNNDKFIFKLRKYNGTQLYLAVACLGSEDDAEKYRCVLKLQSTANNKTQIQWTTQVFTIHESVDKLHETGNLFVISEDTLLPFCKKDVETDKIQLLVGICIESAQEIV